MSTHLLYEDFFRFLDALDATRGDPWELYQAHYVEPHRAVLEAYWRQVLGRPDEVWAARVRAVRPAHYGLLRALVETADLRAIAADAMQRCQRLVRLEPEPDVYFLVGFFSPDAFAFEVEGRWAIGVGMERLGGLRLVPILLVHEYAHCYRRLLGRPANLGDRMVEEGLAVELAARAFPERPTAEHLLMTPGQLSALHQYERKLWKQIEHLLGSEEEEVAARVLYGRAPGLEWASRAGVYLGWRLVRKYLSQTGSGFDVPSSQVIAARRRSHAGRPAPSSRDG